MVHIHRLSIQTEVPAAFVVRDPRHPYVDLYADERMQSTEFVAALMRLLTSDEWKRLMAQRDQMLVENGLAGTQVTVSYVHKAAAAAVAAGASPDLVEWVTRRLIL